jgi:hypothetical protein
MYKKEEWKTIPNFSKYLASSLGRIKTTKNRILLGYYQNGYKIVKVTNDTNKRCSVGMHRLVALAFIPNPLNLQTVNHIDKIRDNNCLDNLEWLSVKDNNIHSKIRKKSSFQGGSKFYEKDLKIIHKMLEYKVPRKDIEEIYELDRNVLTNLFNSKHYKEDCKKLGLSFDKFHKNRVSKIIELNKKEIISMLKLGYSYRTIAKKFNVSHSSIIQFNKDIV